MRYPEEAGSREEVTLNTLLTLQTLALLGIRNRYWVIIIVVVIVIIAIGFFARGRRI